MIEKRRHDRRVGRVALLELTDFRAALALVEKLEELEGVHEVAIVGEGDRAIGARAERRLGIHPVACPGRGIARVAHGHVALKSLEIAFVEHLRDETHVFVDEDLFAV